MSGQDPLGLFGRLEPLHLPLSPPRRPMRILRRIIQIPALSVLDAGKQVTLSDAVAPQLVGHDHPRHVLQTLQKPPKEALRRVGIAPGLNENVEHDAILIDGTPEIVLHTLDPDEDLVHVPLVPWARPASTQASSETCSEFLAPASRRLVR